MHTKMTTRRLGFAPAALLALATLHAPLAAQGVTYTSVARPEMAGAMGMLARLVPGAMAETKVTTSTQGPFLRTDEGEARSTITDMAAGRYTYLDHEEKTFYSLTLEQMMAQARAAMGDMAEAQPAGGMPELQVERTGKTQSFDGYTAEQVLLYMEPAVGAGDEPPEEDAGTVAILVELWISSDFPGAEALKKVQEAMATGAGADMAGAFAGDPAMMEAGRRIAEEMKGLAGIPVRTVTSSVMVPPGATFDKDAVLAASDKPLQSGSAAGAAAGAARQALGGLMGRRRQQEQPAPDAAPTQSVIMRVVQTVQDVKVGAIPDERFQVPAGYREVPPPTR